MKDFGLSRICQSPNVVSHSFDGVVYLIGQDGNRVRVLNEVASAIWLAAAAPITVDEIVKCIVDQFQVTHSRAQKDVKNFVKRYVRLGLLMN